MFPAHVRSHLSKKHHQEYHPEIREKIVISIAEIEGLAEDEGQYNLPELSGNPIPYLETERIGFKCRECGVIQYFNRDI